MSITKSYKIDLFDSMRILNTFLSSLMVSECYTYKEGKQLNLSTNRYFHVNKLTRKRSHIVIQVPLATLKVSNATHHK